MPELNTMELDPYCHAEKGNQEGMPLMCGSTEERHGSQLYAQYLKCDLPWTHLKRGSLRMKLTQRC